MNKRKNKGFLGGFSTKMTAYVFQNKLVLYILLFVSIFNILYLGVQGQVEYIFVFILLAFLSIFFTKNMALILTISLFMTNVLIFFSLIDCQCDRSRGAGAAREGYSGGADHEEDDDAAPPNPNPNPDPDKKGKKDGGGGGGEEEPKHDMDFQKFEDMNSKLVGEINGKIIPKLEYMEKFLKSYEKENFSKP